MLTRSCQFIRLFVSVSPFISPPLHSAWLSRSAFAYQHLLSANTPPRSGPVQARCNGWEVLCAVLVDVCLCSLVCVCARMRTCLKKTKLSTHATCLSPFIIRVGVLALVFLSTFISIETFEILQSLIWFSSALKMLLECKHTRTNQKRKKRILKSWQLLGNLTRPVLCLGITFLRFQVFIEKKLKQDFQLATER